MLKLVHQVTGFLLRLPADQLAGIADGRLALTVGGPAQPAPAVAEAKPPLKPRTARPPAQREASDDYSEIVAGLRRQESTVDGLTYLSTVQVNGRKLRKTDLLAVGRHLKVDIPSSLTVAMIRRRLVDQASGARRKYEGLRP
ncbi:hypothetical protein AB0C12_41085 [Actinoplanes sp. NPDC048967]|uniref:hypothetical protein n=1 Tax=Actinoplanes sp. NPDC048967 TaxID=3155269 RepID=UPI0034010EF0